MTKGMDCSENTLGKAHELAAKGIRFVARYLPSGTHKSLTRQEAVGLASVGIWIISVFEIAADDALGGAARGKQDALRALASAHVVGQPAGTIIYFACDFDASEAQMPQVVAYYQAVHDALKARGYLTGVYGSGRVCEAVKGAGWANKAWLAMSRGWAEHTYKDYDLIQTSGGVICGIEADADISKGAAGGWQPVAHQ